MPPPPKDHAVTDADLDDGLAGLMPKVRTITFGSTVVHVRELPINEIAPLVEQFRSVLAAMKVADADVLDFVQRHPAETSSVAAAVTGIPAGTWRKAGAGKLIAVLTAAAEVNADFFVQCVGLGAILGALAGEAPGDGSTPSATSSAPGTPAP
jgi:hypothetical protein